MSCFGQLLLLGTLVGSGYSAFACTAGWHFGHCAVRRSGIVAAMASAAALTTVTAILAGALLARDFRLAYVVQYCDRVLPWPYALSALWVGQAGSLLLWAWFSALLALAFHFRPGRNRTPLRYPATGLLMGYCCFLVTTMVFAADPMAASLAVPRDGAGLNPLLQHPAMLVHPPLVLLGYAACAIPCALALAALAAGRFDGCWIQEARPWVLFGWLVLGSGILLGAEWAYEELGWGGYWSWDPVENGSLIPWLTGTASMHTLMAWQYRGVLKRTTVVLAILTFGMCNFATFLTRSGIFSSLHAFSQSPIGWLFLLLMLGLTVASTVMVVMRRRCLTSDGAIASIWSRESMIVLATIALLVLAAATWFGTLSGALAAALIGRSIIVGPPFYHAVLMPVGLVLLVTTAMAPLLKWGVAPTRAQTRQLLAAGGVATTASGIAFAGGVRHPLALTVVGLVSFAALAFVTRLVLDAHRHDAKNLWLGLANGLRTGRRQYAGFLAHIGFFCLAAGVTGSSLGTRQVDVALSEGETVNWAGRSIRLVAVTRHELADRRVAEAKLQIAHGAGAPYLLTPAQHLHLPHRQWTTEVAIRSTWSGDFYTILQSDLGGGRVRLSLVDNPMMRWIWLSGSVMGLAVLAALWPTRKITAQRHVPAAGRFSGNCKRYERIAAQAALLLLSGAMFAGLEARITVRCGAVPCVLHLVEDC